MAAVTLKKVQKTFDKTEVVHGIDLEVRHEEFVVLVGPSGCGKSTTLRMIAGLEDITQGDIFIGDRKVNEVQPKDRDIAMVFQNYALYPHMTVFGNMSFGLKLRKYNKTEIQSRVEKAADILGIRELLERRPKQLSGGQRQRVAMGRAIVRQPEVFLFDEPLSNLDAKLRVQMRMEIKRLHHNLKATIIYVTHDQVEAMTLADRIVVMSEGNIEQVGTPQELYDTPATLFVAGFIGSPAMNFVPCRLVRAGDGLAVKLNEEVSLPIPKERTERYREHLDAVLTFGIRPEHLTEKRPHDTRANLFDIEARVDVLEPMGMDTTVFFNINTTELCARVNPAAARSPGEIITLMADMDKMHLIDPASGIVI